MGFCSIITTFWKPIKALCSDSVWATNLSCVSAGSSFTWSPILSPAVCLSLPSFPMLAEGFGLRLDLWWRLWILVQWRRGAGGGIQEALYGRVVENRWVTLCGLEANEIIDQLFGLKGAFYKAATKLYVYLCRMRKNLNENFVFSHKECKSVCPLFCGLSSSCIFT